ncbi:hypothetical protein [Inquilinus sp. CA228]|uniref:hypothetical protein n=1 Tax=Inquilinus sp. CA228 TaxID=3455609 RepID=UPI003F8D7657
MTEMERHDIRPAGASPAASASGRQGQDEGVVKIRFRKTQFVVIGIFGALLLFLTIYMTSSVISKGPASIVVAWIVCFLVSLASLWLAGLFLSKNKKISRNDCEILLSRSGLFLVRYGLPVPWSDVEAVRTLRAPGVHQIQFIIKDSGRANLKQHVGKKFYGAANVGQTAVVVNLKWLAITKNDFYDAVRNFSHLKVR